MTDTGYIDYKGFTGTGKEVGEILQRERDLAEARYRMLAEQRALVRDENETLDRIALTVLCICLLVITCAGAVYVIAHASAVK